MTKVLRLSLAVCVVCVAASGLAGQSLHEKIIFESDRGGDFDIWMMDPDGNNLELLLEKPGDQRVPMVSPDGTKLAYADYPTALAQLMVRNLVTGEDILIEGAVGAAAWYYAWNPDSLSLVSNNNTDCSNDPYVYPIGGQRYPMFTMPARQSVQGIGWATGILVYTSDPCWSPNMVIRTYDPNTGVHTTIQGNDRRSEGFGDVSEDGLFYAYSKADAGYWNPRRIHVMGTDGSGETRVSSNNGLTDHYPDFSPDGDRLVFTRIMSSTDADLHIVGIYGENQWAVLDDSFINMNPSWGMILLDDPCTFGPPDAPLSFVRTKGQPNIELVTWSSCGGEGEMVVTTDHAASAYVILNGAVLLSSSDFNAHDQEYRLPIYLFEEENTLEVELRSKPGSYVEIEFFEGSN